MDKKNLEVPNFFPNKQIMPQPHKMKVHELMNYQSLDEQKIATSIKNYKAAIPYLAGLGVGMLLVKFYADRKIKAAIYGENSTI